VRFLVCGAKQRGFQGGWPPWSKDAVREGEALSEARVGRGKAKLSPSKKPMWEPHGLTNPPAVTGARAWVRKSIDD
jgi:hypothetical protein